jgi:primosomal replication protein N
MFGIHRKELKNRVQLSVKVENEHRAFTSKSTSVAGESRGRSTHTRSILRESVVDVVGFMIMRKFSITIVDFSILATSFGLIYSTVHAVSVGEWMVQ